MKNPLNFLLCLTLALNLCSCKKTKPVVEQEEEPLVTTELKSGLPENLGVNGYLYCSVTSQTAFSNPTYFIAVNAFFSDPTRALMSGFNHYQNFVMNDLGNISVGAVSFSGNQVNGISDDFSFSYRLTRSLSPFSYEAHWTTEGNGPFKPLNENLSRGFPRISQNLVPGTISRSNGYSFNAGACIANYDSVVVLINGQQGLKFRKAIAAPEKTLTFTAADLAGAFTPFQSSASIQINAFNYMNRTIESKRYVFELADKYSYNAYFVD
jgi:hypothetical protein